MAAGKETRLGVVLNGGVSLAVWMSGVTHEIDLLRRASRRVSAAADDDIEGVAQHDGQIFQRWVQFCRQHDVGRVVVDVVAGTSAGGLNGALLATAVGRGASLDPPGGGSGPRLRRVWNESAALVEDRLVRSAGQQPLPSVLDGVYFENTVQKVFGELAGPDTGGDDEPVTLFVTATALGESNQRYVDSFGHPFDVADHRRLYRFRNPEPGACRYVPSGDELGEGWFPPEDRNDFASGIAPIDETGDALSRAARASASFPFAFAPVQESPTLARHRVIPPLAAQAADEPTWLMDGGILDNSPFGPVLDAVTRRQLSGEVERLVVYVAPSAGTAETDAAPQASGDRPGEPQQHAAWPTIAGAAVGLPNEADLRGDITDTERLVAHAEGLSAAPEAVFADAVHSDATRLLDSAGGLLEQYRVARTIGGLREIRDALGRADPTMPHVLAARRVADAHAILRSTRPAWVPPSDARLAASADAEGWCWGLTTAERVVRYMLRDVRAKQAHLTDQHVASDALRGLSVALARIEAVRDAVNDRLHHATDAPTGAGVAADLALLEWIRGLFGELRVPDALAWCVGHAADAYAGVFAPTVSADRAVTIGLAVEVVSQAFTAYRPFERTAPFNLLRLGPDVDTPACDRAHTDLDAVRRQAGRKLYGLRMHHFAAFGLDEWRAWDWLCGRLDAQVHLARALAGSSPQAPPERAEQVERWIEDIQRLTMAADPPGKAEAVTPDAFVRKRAALLDLTDGALLRELRGHPAGNAMIVGVVDAAMRALPEPLALGAPGLVANTLLARKPRTWFATVWTPFARPLARWWWRRRTHVFLRRTGR